ncbi:hypothetical protein NDU88_008730 [Pleurodeles waltl]|uniref:Uncharacterized protein n=1 Tax=Pleurodeles waltl TaxID=8319 RepID=A0AAV7PPZ5_PLEWA|nr:hypothetical protein NDU88_008730 [Pleurodeles waltl]
MGPLLLTRSACRSPLLADILLFPTVGRELKAKSKNARAPRDEGTALQRSSARGPRGRSALLDHSQGRIPLFRVRGSPLRSPQSSAATSVCYGGGAQYHSLRPGPRPPLQSIGREDSHRTLPLPPRRVRAISSSAPDFHGFLLTAPGPAGAPSGLPPLGLVSPPWPRYHPTFLPFRPLQSPATPLSSVDVSAGAEKGSGWPPFTGSLRFLCLEDREALPLSPVVLRSSLLFSLPVSLSSGDSGTLLLAPGGSSRSRYRRPPWRLTAAT